MQINPDLEKVITGINKAADIITSTMGGAGMNVILNNRDNFYFTKDGVSVADRIKFQDLNENIGAKLLINATNKTVTECGDGTTGTALFVQTLINESLDWFKDTEVADISTYTDDLEKALVAIKDELKSRAKKVENTNDIYNIAYTSSKSAVIANLIREIYQKTGFKASIAVELARHSNNTYYDIVKGLSFESGLVHNGFATEDNGSCVLENVDIEFSQTTMADIDMYEDKIRKIRENDDSILFIAPMFSDHFIRTAIAMKRQGVRICLIKSPGYGQGVLENYKDIATFCNPQAARVVVTQDGITFYNTPDKKLLKKRVTTLTRQADIAVDEYFANDYLRRIDALNQSCAIIYVSDYTEKGAKEKYDRIEDAVFACKAALREGYVRGAGVELYNIETENPIWNKVLKRAFNKIYSNSGRIKKIETDRPFNLKTGNYDDNIVDPVAVLNSCLDNAYSFCSLILNTSFVVND